MGLFKTVEDSQQEKLEHQKREREKIIQQIKEAEKKEEIPEFSDLRNSAGFMKSNLLKKTAGGTITGETLKGLGSFGFGGSLAKANELKLALANNELLEILVRQNEEIIKLLKAKKK